MDKNLSELREMIDIVDSKIIECLKERFEITSLVAEFKKKNGLEIFQVKREEELFKRLKIKSSEVGLDEKFVCNLFEFILKESKRRQSE